MTGLRRRPVAWALVVLLAIGIALSGFEMVSSANEVNRIRGDFCDWSAVHYRVLTALRRRHRGQPMPHRMRG